MARDYEMVSNSLWRLGDSIRKSQESRRADEMRMQELGLQRAQLEYGITAKEAENKRERYLNEEVTGREAIMGSKLSEKAKKTLLETAPPELLDGLVFTRKKWAEGLSKSIVEFKRRQAEEEKEQGKIKRETERINATQKYRSERLGIERQKLNKHGGSNEQKNLTGLRQDYKIALEQFKDAAGEIDTKIRREINKAYQSDKKLIRSGKPPVHLMEYLSRDEKQPSGDGFEEFLIRYDK